MKQFVHCAIACCVIAFAQSPAAQPVADKLPDGSTVRDAPLESTEFVPLLSDEQYQQIIHDYSYGGGECVSIQTINGRVYRRSVPCTNEGGSWWLPIGIVTCRAPRSRGCC